MVETTQACFLDASGELGHSIDKIFKFMDLWKSHYNLIAEYKNFWKYFWFHAPSLTPQPLRLARKRQDKVVRYILTIAVSPYILSLAEIEMLGREIGETKINHLQLWLFPVITFSPGKLAIFGLDPSKIATQMFLAFLYWITFP